MRIVFCAIFGAMAPRASSYSLRGAMRAPGAARAVSSRRLHASARALAARCDASVVERDDIRNIAIVAHVDHGKTTLVDAMLQSTKTVTETLGKDDRVMDNNDQERERGITILAKNAAIEHRGVKVNIVDTPGHADFGGEVERVLNMVDGVLLLVDAAEGPKPQTRFVLKKALAMGHRVLVVVNKIDRPAARPDYVVDKTFDLFCELGASDEQTDFPIIYSSAINRVAGVSPDAIGDDMSALLDEILELPKPQCDASGPLQLQVSNIGADPFIGRLGIGRIKSGVVSKGMPVAIANGPGSPAVPVAIKELFAFDSLGRKPIEKAEAGEIVVFAGITDELQIGATVVDRDDPQPLEPMTVEQPTMSISIGVNKTPFAGKSGKRLTSRNIRERLEKELETNVALQVQDTLDSDTVQVFGRGLLHLTVLIETMRREGFELMVGCPRVIEKEIDGKRMEPFETVDVEMPEEHSGSVIDMLGQRKGSMLEMGSTSPEGILSVVYEVPSRAMAGVKTAMMSSTKGLAVMTTTFAGYRPHAGEFDRREKGNLLSHELGQVTGYGIARAQERGVLFAGPGDDVYENQIIGISARPGDLKVNICRKKQLTNMRSAGNDDFVNIVPAKQLTLEDAVEYVEEGEFVEVTPEAIRMYKASAK